jgi:hypothetical protein
MHETTETEATRRLEDPGEGGRAEDDVPMGDTHETGEHRGAGKGRLWVLLGLGAAAVAIAAGAGLYAGYRTGGVASQGTAQAQAAMAMTQDGDAQGGQDGSGERRAVLSAIDQDGVAALVNDMALPQTSKVTVAVSDRRVIVTESCDLVAKLVPERACDRAAGLARLLDATLADTVTWVLDNGKGATAAVTVAVGDTGTTEGRGVAEKLAASVGYALNEGAYEPVCDVVKEPTGGVEPTSAEGDPLLTPAVARQAETTGSASSSRAPSETKDEGAAERTTSTSTSAGTTSGSSRTPSGSTSSSSTSGTTSGTTSSSSGRSGSSGSSSSETGSASSSEPTKHWVEEQGHWEDTYEEREVRTGTRWVVDKEAWDEEVTEQITTYVCSDGHEAATAEEADAYVAAALENDGTEITYETVVANVVTDVIRHEEQGHYEDAYETQKVKTGTKWVVDVEGHWE